MVESLDRITSFGDPMSNRAFVFDDMPAFGLRDGLVKPQLALGDELVVVAGPLDEITVVDVPDIGSIDKEDQEIVIAAKLLASNLQRFLPPQPHQFLGDGTPRTLLVEDNAVEAMVMTVAVGIHFFLSRTRDSNPHEQPYEGCRLTRSGPRYMASDEAVVSFILHPSIVFRLLHIRSTSGR